MLLKKRIPLTIGRMLKIIQREIETNYTIWFQIFKRASAAQTLKGRRGTECDPFEFKVAKEKLRHSSKDEIELTRISATYNDYLLTIFKRNPV